MATDPVISILPPYTPELLPTVQSCIEEYIRKVKDNGAVPSVLEIGSGWSTIWFAMIGCKLTSVEHDVGWFVEVNNVLDKEGLDSPDISTVCIAPNEFVTELANDTNVYDVVLVDCIDEQRVRCVEVCKDKVRVGGLMVVDDTHWESMQSVFGILREWEHISFSGMHVRKTGVTLGHETTIFIRR